MFLPRLQDKELPSKQARTDVEIAEERRLLYVGLTRAKRVLWLSWWGKRVAVPRGARRRRLDASPSPKADWTPDAQRLREWRLERAKADDVPPYVVFHDTVLHAIAAARPGSLGELAQISGVGPAKLERYGEEVLAPSRADSKRSSISCGSRRSRPPAPSSRFSSSSARGSVSGRSRPSRISCSSTPPSRPP